MNKILWLLLLGLGAWTVKLSVDVYELKNLQMGNLTTSIDQQSQRIGSLSDQLTALKNQNSAAPRQTREAQPASADQAMAYHIEEYVHDRLQLINLMLQQQQITPALAQIITLQQQLMHEQPLPESLNTAVIQALQKDQQVINQYVQQRQQQLQLLQQQLIQVENAMQAAPLNTEQQKWSWASWLHISKADNTPDLENRQLHYQYLKLKLVLAQQALSAGEIAVYQTQLTGIIHDLALYPDEHSQQLSRALQQLQKQPMMETPQLSAAALLQGD